MRVVLSDVQKAREELRQYLPVTPLLRSAWLSERLECDLYLKLETMQPIGSFKIRGACYRISRLSKAEKRKGVIAASAGNHAQGVAWGSAKYGVRATIVMPRGAPLTKIQNTQALGAEVLLEGDTYDEAFAVARKLARKSGQIYVHAFENEHVIAGQGTMWLEILEQLPDVDVVIGSIGGGGLMAGTGIVLKALRPEARIVGCQAVGAPSMIKTLKAGKLITSERMETFADGIAVKQPSPALFKILKNVIDETHLVEDEDTVNAVLTLLEKAKIVSEGAGAIGLAAAEKIASKLKGKKVCLIISGGNIDVNVLSRIIDRGLIRAGRRLRVNVMLSDRPGSLARLTDLIARQGANVLQAIHDRSEPSTTIDQTDVALTLETRGPDHSRALLKELKASGFQLELVN